MPTNAEWLERFEKIMPWGSGTCSKAVTYFPDEPNVITHGKGCRVWDANGKEYIDFRNSLGPVTLGHAYPEVNQAIIEQLNKGIIFGHPTPLECEVAEIACKMIPCGEKARFLKTGGEACAAAIKIARAFTGRDHIIQLGYNGWLNSVARGTKILPGRIAEPGDYPKGIPSGVGDYFHSCGWNNETRIKELFSEYNGKIAAVLVQGDYLNPEDGHTFFPFVREITAKNGALLIFDEIVKGMRIAIGGAHDYFKVKPDLAVLSKGIANGMPLAVYLGRADVMEACGRKGGAVVSSTFAGEALSLAAAKACFAIYEREDVIGYLWKMGSLVWDGLNEIFKRKGLGISVVGFSPTGTFKYEDNKLTEPFMRAAYRNGVCLYGTSYINYSHKEADVAETLERLERACGEI
jgi:glutamate-1-semialdehyde 2,1-aminomutase